MSKVLFFLERHKYKLATIIYIFGSFSCGLSLAFTKDAYIDRFLTDINNPNKHNYYNGFVSPFLKIKKNPEFISSTNNKYDDLLSYFYTDSLTNDCREVVDHNISICNDDFLNSSLKLITQGTFRIRNDKRVMNGDENIYYEVDKGMYYSYFSGDELSEYMSIEYKPRFEECSLFLYISDTLADKLVKFYGIENKENPYLELLSKKEYAILSLSMDDEPTPFKASINSIVSTRYRFAPQTQKIYGDFAITNSNDLKKITSLSFDVDFKVNQYGNKKTIDVINKLGYNISNSTFNFYKYDYEKAFFYNDSLLNNTFFNIYSKQNYLIILFYLLFSVLMMALLSLFFITRSVFTRADRILLCINLAAFCLYGIIANFINLFHLYSIFPIFGLVCIIVLFWKGIFKQNESIEFCPAYNEISI